MSVPSVPRSAQLLYLACLWMVAIAGLYLYFLARYSMNPLISWVVCLHAAGGLVLGIPFCIFVLRAAATFARFRHTPSLVIVGTSGLAVVLTGAILISVPLFGVSNSRYPYVIFAHIWMGGLAVAAGALVTRRQIDQLRISLLGSSTSLTIITLSLFAITPGAVLGTVTYRADHFFRTLTATNALQAGNRLFPSGAAISNYGEWEIDSCGKSGCHDSIHREWITSSHGMSAASSAYIYGQQISIREHGPGSERWCQGCHIPLAGTGKPPEPKTTSIVPFSPNVRCSGCHSMRQANDPIGNGYAEYAPPPSYRLRGLTRDSSVENYLIRLRPIPHVRALQGPDKGTVINRICAPCHRLTVGAAQNHFRFLRLDNTWAEWQESAFSGNSLHSIRPPNAIKTCIDCHFGIGVGHASGNFLGKPPTADVTPRLSVEVFALRRSSPTFGSLERLEAPLSNRQVFLDPGESVSVDVLVQSRDSGHSFPAANATERDAWLSLHVLDDKGHTLLQSSPNSSVVTGQGPHRYGVIAIDKAGRETPHIRAQDTAAIAYRSQIKEDVGDVARFRFTVPNQVHGTISIHALLCSSETQAIQPNGHKIEVLAQNTVSVGIRAAGGLNRAARLGEFRDDPQKAPSFREYGYALLSQKDVTRAGRAFQLATSLAPGDAENPIATARAKIEEGDLLSARDSLQHALQLSPSSPRARVWLGRTFRLMGQFDKALLELEPLAKVKPMDMETWLDIGLCYFSGGRYRDAIQPFIRILEIDPSNEVGHFNLMQCYRKLRMISDARREEAIYRVLHLDSAPEVVSDYMRSHPHIASEAASIHEHTLGPVQ